MSMVEGWRMQEIECLPCAFGIAAHDMGMWGPEPGCAKNTTSLS
jgi:hypothetical protein